MNNPAFEVGQVVYFRESAAIGNIEPIIISSIMSKSDTWLYSVRFKGSMPTASPQYGDKISVIHATTIFYQQSELITLCEALEIAEQNAQRVLNKIQAQRTAVCPQTE